MEHDENDINRSGNRPFAEVAQARLSRRKAITGGLSIAATSFFTASGIANAATGGLRGPGQATGQFGRNGLLNFAPVPNALGSGPVPAISSDYRYEVIIPWGAPLNMDWSPGDLGSLTWANQAERVGIGHDGMWFFPVNGSNEHGMLAINHEFGSNEHVFGVLGKAGPDNLDDVRLSQHAHGVSVIELRKLSGGWQPVGGRRIHVNTPVAFSGPVAGSSLLWNTAGNEPMGTVNNCANGYTPWGTYLTCEENFNGYFGATGAYARTPAQARYGLTSDGFGYGWEDHDPRFDLSNPAYANEQHRFGWIVEIDPFDYQAKPVKRTALGRFKHEGIAIVEGRGGRIVGYMGDDERFDYIYKFVSDANWKSMRARGMSPLDHGRLYVARFSDDGTGEWLELTIKNPTLAANFTSQEEVLTFARMAADLLGATPMDRPEWTTVAPSGEVYCTLTNNSNRTQPGPANPLAPNADGHIIKWLDSDQHTGTTFTWDIFLIARDTHGTEDSFADPDGLWADPDGRLFIQTDGGQKDGLNNQLIIADTFTGELRRLLTGVTGDEITGIALTPDRRTLFVNTQHPGDGDPAVSNFPIENAVPDGQTIPRDCTFVITRRDGGIIGS